MRQSIITSNNIAWHAGTILVVFGAFVAALIIVKWVERFLK